MADDKTYCVRRSFRGRDSVIAKGIDTMADAAEVALRLTVLQETELGGDAYYYAEVE